MSARSCGRSCIWSSPISPKPASSTCSRRATRCAGCVTRALALGVLTLLAIPHRRFSPAAVALVEDLAAREVQNASGARDQMLATLSHELRSAMNAVLGWAQILRSLDAQGPSTALAARALDTIERNTRLQAQLIEDLFDVSRIVSGKLTVDRPRPPNACGSPPPSRRPACGATSAGCIRSWRTSSPTP